MTNHWTDGGILIVDDQEAHVRLVETILRMGGFTRITTTTDPRNAASLYQRFRPDIVLLDLMMFPMNGFAVMEGLRALIPDDEYLPIVILTADVNPAHRHRALTLGAKDFVTKPYDHDEVVLRVRNLLETRLLFLALRQRDKELAELATAL
jgi:DNA-binding response OmpR family regulator